MYVHVCVNMKHCQTENIDVHIYIYHTGRNKKTINVYNSVHIYWKLVCITEQLHQC